MEVLAWLPWLLLVSMLGTVAGSYRYLYLENADICSKEKSDSKTLDIGAGSAIFALENASMYKTDKTRDKYKKCQILVKANEGYGLMAYVEQMHLRQDTRPSAASGPKCIDYIQFGRDDMIPFVTVYKSDKFCGERTGLKYDEPGGNLLVWLTLGPSRPSSYREALGVVKLSLIVTAYQKEGTKELTSYRACNEGRRWIRKEYFCDGRTNCALDADPADESQLSCPHKSGKDLTTSGPSGGGEDIHPPLNLISITLVLVSCVVLLVLIAMLMLRVKRSGRCCWHRPGDPLCELPEHGPLSLHQLARHPNQATDNLYGGDNNYLPLSHNVIVEAGHEGSLGRAAVPGRGVTAESSLVHRTTPDQEPPPAYHDLFPADYVFEDKQDVVDGEAKEESAPTAKDNDSPHENDDGETSESHENVSEDVSSGNLNRISIVSDDPNTPRD